MKWGTFRESDVPLCFARSTDHVPLRRGATTGRGAPPTTTLASHQVRPGGRPSQAPPRPPAGQRCRAPRRPPAPPSPAPAPRRPPPPPAALDSKRAAAGAAPAPAATLLAAAATLERPTAGAAQPVQGRWAAAARRAAGGGGRQPAGAAAAPDPAGRRRCRARRSVSAGSGDSDTAAATSRQPCGRSKAQAARRRCALAARLAAQQRPAGADGGGDDRATLQRVDAARSGGAAAAAGAGTRSPRCAIPSRSLPTRGRQPAPLRQRRVVPAFIHIRNSSGVRRSAGGAAWAALPRGPPPKHSAKKRALLPGFQAPQRRGCGRAPGPGCGSCHHAPWLPEGGRRLREGEGEQSRRTETVGRLNSGRPVHSKGRLETSRLRSCSRAVKRPARL